MFVEILNHVGGAQSFANRFGKLEDGEAFGQGVFHPGRELRCALLIFDDGFIEKELCLFGAGRIEDVTDIGGDFFTHGDFGDVVLRVLLEVKLASLPGAGRKDGAQSSAQSFVGITGDGLGEFKTAFFEATQEVTPVDFGFGQ